ncbi:MAG: thioredoxin [Candidatus Krumholzibacteria bacterium]|nr:thioredoxin [Candidatus Krumholzibacteria bacterium]
MSDNIIHVQESDFQSQVLDSGIPVVVDFWAPWCAPCLVLGPILEELATEYDGRVKFTKLDTSENQGVAASYGIMAIPMIKIFKDGKEIDSLTGAVPKGYLKDFIEKALGA